MKLVEPFTFFVDRSLGGAFVAAALRAAQQIVVVHDDEFQPDARDVDWLTAVGAKGWIVLTKDARIRTNALEREALLAARAPTSSAAASATSCTSLRVFDLLGSKRPTSTPPSERARAPFAHSRVGRVMPQSGEEMKKATRT